MQAGRALLPLRTRHPRQRFIQFGYWDSLHKGLLAGETLNHDLRRMQSSYLEQNARRFEISRFVSLARWIPARLRTLLETGACDFDLPNRSSTTTTPATTAAACCASA